MNFDNKTNFGSSQLLNDLFLHLVWCHWYFAAICYASKSMSLLPFDNRLHQFISFLILNQSNIASTLLILYGLLEQS